MNNNQLAMNISKNGGTITPQNEISGLKDSRYLFNNSQNKNFIDFDNIFMDGGTGAVTNKQQMKNSISIINDSQIKSSGKQQQMIDTAFSQRVSPVNRVLGSPLGNFLP